MKTKRLMSFFLAAVMSMSTLSWLSLLPAAAEENATDTPVNYAEGLAWNKQVGTPAVSVTDTGAVMSGLANSWDSVGCDILPALKKALGDDERVYLSLSVEVTATMKAGSEGDTLTTRVLMRGTDTRSDLGDSAWNSAYADALGWDPSLFFKQGGNVMSYLNGGLSLKHGKAVVYTTTLELTKNQIECGILTEWIFCVDNLGGMNMSNVESVAFKNLTIVKTEKPSVDEDESFDHRISGRGLVPRGDPSAEYRGLCEPLRGDRDRRHLHSHRRHRDHHPRLLDGRKYVGGALLPHQGG